MVTWARTGEGLWRKSRAVGSGEEGCLGDKSERAESLACGIERQGGKAGVYLDDMGLSR